MRVASRVAAVVLLAGAMPALGYVLPAPSILKQLAKHRDNLRLNSMVVRGTYTFHGDEARRVAEAMKVPNPGSEVPLPVEIAFKMPGKCAITVSAPSGVPADASVVSNVQGKIKGVGPELAVPRIHARLGCPLLFHKTSEFGDADVLLGQFLQGLGVDQTVVSLVRFSGTVAYNIGAKPRDLTRPQFWVRRESSGAAGGEVLRPARLLARQDAALYDLRLIDYASPVSGEWHPRQVDVYQGETLLGRFLAEKVEENVKIADAIF